MTQLPSPDSDHQPLDSVAGRLGKSPRWLQSRLTEDSRRPAHLQRLQHHHYIGGSKRWSEDEYRALSAAIAAADSARQGSRSLPATASGTSTVPCAFQGSTASDARSALERVL